MSGYPNKCSFVIAVPLPFSSPLYEKDFDSSTITIDHLEMKLFVKILNVLTQKKS